MSEFFCPEKTELTPDFKETARYLGYSQKSPPTDDITALMSKAAQELQAALKPQAVFDIFELSLAPAANGGGTLGFGGIEIVSKDLWRNLESCTSVALLAATLGPQVDLLIRRAQATDVVYASVLQATGAMFTEVLVDMVCNRIAQIAEETKNAARPRYSPGYGDVSLECQKHFFNLLPCSKIGLSLMETLIMAPEKSVTAFVGLKPL